MVNQVIPVKISNDITSYLRGIWKQTNYSYTKLQRVEKHLGTDRK
ncbi:hypothetical protein [Cylindrospermum stagnale]|nr:hypothetical protein [Cylindrospermum stagnale]